MLALMSAIAWSLSAQERESCPRMGQAQGLSNPGFPEKSEKQGLKIKASHTPVDFDPGQGGVCSLTGGNPPPHFLSLLTSPLSASQAVSPSLPGPLPPGGLPG